MKEAQSEVVKSPNFSKFVVHEMVQVTVKKVAKKESEHSLFLYL